MAAPPDKVCPACGRRFAYRRRLARNWESVRWCSDGCRARGEGDAAALEARLLSLLARRARGATICPSEALPPAEKQDGARMEAVRAAARRLVHRGEAEITQRGLVVDPDHARGPIRVRRREP